MTPSDYPVIYWFRRDLRLLNNPALSLAARHGSVIPVFILDEESNLNFFPGVASRWWMHYSLKSINRSLGGKLRCFRGARFEILHGLCERYGVREIYCNRYYEAWSLERDSYLKTAFSNVGIQFQSLHDSLLYEPQILNQEEFLDENRFEDFHARFLQMIPGLSKSLPEPNNLRLSDLPIDSLEIEELGLVSKASEVLSLQSDWSIGEPGAWKSWKYFLERIHQVSITQVEESIDYCGSRLSPHLHRGEISVLSLIHELKNVLDEGKVQRFLRWICCREFAALRMLQPQQPDNKINHEGTDQDLTGMRFKAWQEGKTGYPYLDAAMRELYQTGFISHALRQLVSSFLVYNLGVDWRKGRAHFADRLVDADLANNGYNWIKIANNPRQEQTSKFLDPVEEAKHMDPSGLYTLRFLPELKNLPLQYLFEPWLAPEQILFKAGIQLGNDYPKPIVQPSCS
mgnify:CR=1 FL=1